MILCLLHTILTGGVVLDDVQQRRAAIAEKIRQDKLLQDRKAQTQQSMFKNHRSRLQKQPQKNKLEGAQNDASRRRKSQLKFNEKMAWAKERAELRKSTLTKNDASPGHQDAPQGISCV